MPPGPAPPLRFVGTVLPLLDLRTATQQLAAEPALTQDAARLLRQLDTVERVSMLESRFRNAQSCGYAGHEMPPEDGPDSPALIWFPRGLYPALMRAAYADGLAARVLALS